MNPKKEAEIDVVKALTKSKGGKASVEYLLSKSNLEKYLGLRRGEGIPLPKISEFLAVIMDKENYVTGPQLTAGRPELPKP